MAWNSEEKKQPDYGLTPLEAAVKKVFEANSFKVFRNGWPDFLMVSSLGQVIAVEVKDGSDTVKENQKQIHDVLRKINIPVFVVRSRNLGAAELLRAIKRKEDELVHLREKLTQLPIIPSEIVEQRAPWLVIDNDYTEICKGFARDNYRLSQRDKEWLKDYLMRYLPLLQITEEVEEEVTDARADGS